jgi:hypothetical protein
VSAQLPQALRDEIDGLAGQGGWWHSSGLKEFEAIALELLEHGFSKGLVIGLLGRAYGAVAGEFGE